MNVHVINKRISSDNDDDYDDVGDDVKKRNYLLNWRQKQNKVDSHFFSTYQRDFNHDVPQQQQHNEIFSNDAPGIHYNIFQQQRHQQNLQQHQQQPFLDIRISLNANNGSLIFTKTTDADEGIYQCFAQLPPKLTHPSSHSHSNLPHYPISSPSHLLHSSSPSSSSSRSQTS